MGLASQIQELSRRLMPASCSMSASSSMKFDPIASESRAPTVDFPAPLSPTRGKFRRAPRRSRGTDRTGPGSVAEQTSASQPTLMFPSPFSSWTRKRGETPARFANSACVSPSLFFWP